MFYISMLNLRKSMNYQRRIFADVLTTEEFYKGSQNVHVKIKKNSNFVSTLGGGGGDK
jgi:hypothetical protein